MSARERPTPSAPTWAEPIYLDASALVKLFVSEPESEALNQALVGAEDVILSDLALTEMASALGRRMREGRLASWNRVASIARQRSSPPRAGVRNSRRRFIDAPSVSYCRRWTFPFARWTRCTWRRRSTPKRLRS